MSNKTLLQIAFQKEDLTKIAVAMASVGNEEKKRSLVFNEITEAVI